MFSFHRNFYHPVNPVLEYPIGFLNIIKRKNDEL